MNDLWSICSGFGLSGAAGLNAYIPLLTVAIMQNRGALHLAAPYDTLGSGWCIALLAVLLIIEIVVDKVPGADHVNDIIHTAIRPTAGALLFASQAGVIHSVHPGVWMVMGLLMGGGVHATKSLARPVINVSMAGFGAPVVSLVEDLVGTVLSIVSVLFPYLAVMMLGVFAWLLYKIFWRVFGRGGHAIPVRAVAVRSRDESASLRIDASARQSSL